MAFPSIDTYLSNDKDLDVSKGLCVKHEDPDLWFAGEVDLTDPSSSVNTNSQATKLEVEKAIKALSICKNCPAKDNCLELGKRGTDILRYIWRHYGG